MCACCCPCCFILHWTLFLKSLFHLFDSIWIFLLLLFPLLYLTVQNSLYSSNVLKSLSYTWHRSAVFFFVSFFAFLLPTCIALCECVSSFSFCLMARTVNKSDFHPMDIQVNKGENEMADWKITRWAGGEWVRQEREREREREREDSSTKRSRLLLTLIVAPAGWSNGWKDLVFN